MAIPLPTSEVITAIRTRTGETQEALARRLDVTFATLNRWERGRSEPTRLHRAQIDALAADLGISPRPHALLIEDDAGERRLIAAQLQAAGADVTAVADSTEGLVLCGKEHPDIVFVDTSMPGLAADIAAHVKAVEGMSRLLFVALTDEPEKAPGIRGSTQADVVLEKPVLLEELESLLADRSPFT